MLRLILLRLLESYFRHRWLNLLPIVILSIVAGVYFLRLEPPYIAKGVLSIQQESLLARLSSVKGADISWETPSTATVNELYELLQTDSFIRAVISQTDLEAKMSGGKSEVEETIDEVRKSIWSSALGDSQIAISAKYEQPQTAFQLVNSVVETFIQWKINSELSDSQAAFQFFAELSQKYKTEVDSARAELYDYVTVHPAPVKGERPEIEKMEISRLQSQLELAISRYSKTLDNMENSQLASTQVESDARQSYIVIDAPIVPDKPEISRKQIALQLGIFLVVGFLLSAIGIIGAAVLDRTFHFPIDVRQGVDLPVLTIVPDATPQRTQKKRRKKVNKEPEPERDPSEIFTPDQTEEALNAEAPFELQEMGLSILTQAPDCSSDAVNALTIEPSMSLKEPAPLAPVRNKRSKKNHRMDG